MSYEISLGDCHELIKAIPDNSIDAVISDPPYHTTQLDFDKLEVNWSLLWGEIYRACKPNAVQVMFSAQPFTTDLINSNRERFRYLTVWQKTMTVGFLDAKRKPLKAHEDILIFCESPHSTTYNPQKHKTQLRKIGHQSSHQTQHYGAIRIDNRRYVNEGYPRSIVSFSNGHGGSSLHPTQKPLELLCYLVKTYTNKNDKVLDPFMGSGTTLEACYRLGRKSIGFEVMPKYFKVASKRLKTVAAQPSLELEAQAQ